MAQFRPRSASAPTLHDGCPIFAYRALPRAPKEAGSFERFRYSTNPFEALQEHNWQHAQKERAKIRAGQFKPGGKGLDAKRRSLKLRAPELKAAVFKTLQHDWPSFLRVDTDDRGVLLACFSEERLSSERRADLHVYMNRMLKMDPTLNEYWVTRDPMCWGVVMLEGADLQQPPVHPPPLVYALRPPWVTNDLGKVTKWLREQQPQVRPQRVLVRSASKGSLHAWAGG